MLRYTGGGEPEEGDWIIDSRTQEPAISKLDESQLRQVAEDLGLPYQHRFDSSSLQELIDDIDIDDASSDGRRDAIVYRGVYWIGAFLLAALLAWEGWDLLRQVPSRRGTSRGEQDPLAGTGSPAESSSRSPDVPTGTPDVEVPR